MVSVIIGIGVLCTPVSFPYMTQTVFATENGTKTKETGDQVASDDERLTQTPVGEEGAYAKYPEDLNDGVYEIEADTSSSMFQITKAELTVENGAMRAHITLGGTGYLRLYMGTGQEAVAADPAAYAEYMEDAKGAYTYDIEVAALDQSLECTGFSKRKEKWYDHQISFLSSSLPEGALKERIADGTYTCPVTMTGGSGKASIESPALLTAEDGKVFARIVWSSPNYDYMKVAGRQYLPVNTSGNSEFLIPVTSFDGNMTVIADTTAMSKPHEIVYTFTFRKDGLEKKSKGNTAVFVGGCVLAVLCGLAAFFAAKKRKGKAKEQV